MALAATGLIVVSMISSPVAGARQSCRDTGGAIRCETSGSTSIKAVPQTRAMGPQAGMIGGIGGLRRGMLWGW
ncbi:hypothetical protein [Mycolicibacterium brumae]|nr:hypothetical protein [Mycolicibacterium brumae]UWW07707.1 hypothetical protein L2Z93_000734 [Mycolicibacterium brumae]